MEKGLVIVDAPCSHIAARRLGEDHDSFREGGQLWERASPGVSLQGSLVQGALL